MRIVVEIFASFQAFEEDPGAPIGKYEMNHEDENERRALGHRCRDCFENGQVVVTYRKP